MVKTSFLKNQIDLEQQSVNQNKQKLSMIYMTLMKPKGNSKTSKNLKISKAFRDPLQWYGPFKSLCVTEFILILTYTTLV